MAQTEIRYGKKWLWGDNYVNIQRVIMVIVFCTSLNCHLSLNQVSFQSPLHIPRYGVGPSFSQIQFFTHVTRFEHTCHSSCEICNRSRVFMYLCLNFVFVFYSTHRLLHFVNTSTEHTVCFLVLPFLFCLFIVDVYLVYIPRVLIVYHPSQIRNRTAKTKKRFRKKRGQ